MLSRLEKQMLLAALSFFYNYGEHFVQLHKGDPEENKKLWEQGKPVIKQLFYRIKEKQ